MLITAVVEFGIRPVAVHVELQDTIRAIVEDEKHDGDFVVRRGPQRLVRVKRRAITGNTKHRTLERGELDADGARETLTDAATGGRKVVTGIGVRQRAVHFDAGA